MKCLERKEVWKIQLKEANVVDANVGSCLVAKNTSAGREEVWEVHMKGGSIGKQTKKRKKEASEEGRVCQGMEK